MKVAIDIHNLLMPKTGIGYYVHELGSSLSRLDVDDDFYLFYFSRRRSLDLPFVNDVVHEHRVASLRVRFLGFLWRWFSFPKIDQFIPEVDIYHFPNFFMRPHRRGKRIITIHDLSYIRYPQYVEPRNLEFLTKQVKLAIDGVDKVIANSEFTRDEIMDFYGVDESKIAVTYLGVRSDFSTDIPEEAVSRLREKYNLPERFILFVGTVEPRKNLIGLIDGFKIMHETHPPLRDVKLVVCGMPGWLCEETIEKMEQPDIAQHIIRTGYVEEEELPVLYYAADVVTMPSWYEGFGFPALEGMACGTPVICSEKTSIAEITGDAAVLIDPAEPESIADALVRVLSDSEFAKTLSEKGLERAREYTWDRTARQTYEAYRSVL